MAFGLEKIDVALRKTQVAADANPSLLEPAFPGRRMRREHSSLQVEQFLEVGRSTYDTEVSKRFHAFTGQATVPSPNGRASFLGQHLDRAFGRQLR